MQVFLRFYQFLLIIYLDFNKIIVLSTLMLKITKLPDMSALKKN